MISLSVLSACLVAAALCNFFSVCIERARMRSSPEAICWRWFGGHKAVIIAATGAAWLLWYVVVGTALK